MEKFGGRPVPNLPWKIDFALKQLSFLLYSTAAALKLAHHRAEQQRLMYIYFTLISEHYHDA